MVPVCLQRSPILHQVSPIIIILFILKKNALFFCHTSAATASRLRKGISPKDSAQHCSCVDQEYQKVSSSNQSLKVLHMYLYAFISLLVTQIETEALPGITQL